MWVAALDVVMGLQAVARANGPLAHGGWGLGRGRSVSGSTAAGGAVLRSCVFGRGGSTGQSGVPSRSG